MLYPTHTCFDDAIENLIWLMRERGREGVKRGEILITHAIIAPDGEDLAHAWIEDDKSVWFSGLLNGQKVTVEADRREYFMNSKCSFFIRYTLFEAYAEEKRTGHYGPWHERIRALCPHVKTEPTKK